MTPYALAFLAGDLLLQFFSELPNPIYIYAALICIIIIHFLLPTFRKPSIIILMFLAGHLLAFTTAAKILAWQLPQNQEDTPIQITGYIHSIPISDPKRTTFNFKLENTHAIVKLYWPGKSNLSVGDKWQLSAKLRRIHDLKNPGSFDYEAWALQNGLRATGSVLTHNKNSLISHEWYRYPIATLRQNMRSHLLPILPHTATAPWLVALIMGERSNIPPARWETLKRTGTNHLMAIAGLHIGFICGFTSILVSWCWRRIHNAALFIPAAKVGSYTALIVAVFYSLLSGFLVPAERACLMLTAFILAESSQRQIPSWHIWSLALMAVLIINPLTVLSESFWLSFGTLAIIIFGMSGRVHPRGIWWKYFRVQWVIVVGLIPLSLLFFQQISLISFLANMIAIPWLGFLVLPFCVLSGVMIGFSSAITEGLLLIADKSLSLLWQLLEWFAAIPVATWSHAISSTHLLLIICIGFLFLLSPIGMPGRWIGFIWLLPLFCWQTEKPATNDFWLTVLDVGQGLSAIVQTNQHVLIYDAGPKLSEQSDAGEHIILPYLHTVGITKIDKMIISHGDNDHIGGASATYKSIPIHSVLTSVPNKLADMHAAYCLAGYTWQWDGVKFEFLYPTLYDLGKNNDSSCVLKISNHSHQALLTGDIEKLAEYKLLQKNKNQLAAGVLIAPHHGSKTSAEHEFVHAVSPRYVIYTTGYRNRYHFPHNEVMSIYSAISTIQMNTAASGMLQIKFGDKNTMLQTYHYRVGHHRYWYE